MKTGHNGIVNDAQGRVKCVFCVVQIPKAFSCIEQHIHGSKHKETLEIMTDNGIFHNEDNTMYCKPCKTILNNDESASQHVDGDQHSNWIAAIEDLIGGEFINLDSYLCSAKYEEDIRCDLCETAFPFTLALLEKHVNSHDHRVHLAEKLKTLNGIFPVENGEEVWCKLCDVYIENKVQAILDHIDDDELHMKWFASMDDIIEDHDISLDEFLSEEHHTTAECGKCNMEIDCTTENLEDHIFSETHLNQFDWTVVSLLKLFNFNLLQ